MTTYINKATLYHKTLRVINSCENEFQLLTAVQYAYLASKRMPRFWKAGINKTLYNKRQQLRPDLIA